MAYVNLVLVRTCRNKINVKAVHPLHICNEAQCFGDHDLKVKYYTSDNAGRRKFTKEEVDVATLQASFTRAGAGLRVAVNCYSRLRLLKDGIDNVIKTKRAFLRTLYDNNGNKAVTTGIFCETSAYLEKKKVMIHCLPSNFAIFSRSVASNWIV